MTPPRPLPPLPIEGPAQIGNRAEHPRIPARHRIGRPDPARLDRVEVRGFAGKGDLAHPTGRRERSRSDDVRRDAIDAFALNRESARSRLLDACSELIVAMKDYRMLKIR